ncbi:MAG: Gfo/Idh/MocA family protein [Syntrophales bacterium]
MTLHNQYRRFLVIGCGSIGKRHIGNLLSLNAGEVTAFDIRPERRVETADKFGISVLDRLDDALLRGPDAVIVAVPTSLHIPLAMKAAEHGCHLFIEKPLSNSLEGMDIFLGRVSEKKIATLVGCNLRFHPGLKMIKGLLEKEQIGKPVAARVEFGQYLPDWRPHEDYRGSYSARLDLGGGIILDAIHEIDYIRWMLGHVSRVACLAGRLSSLETQTEDTAAVLLQFDCGAIGEVHLDYVQRAYSRSCHIIGDRGTIRWDYSSGEVRWYCADSRRWNLFQNPPGWNPNQMYLDEMRHFLKCLDGEENPALDAFEGARVLEIAVAAKKSSETGKFMKTGDSPWDERKRRLL